MLRLEVRIKLNVDICDPPADSLMGTIDHDDFVIFVCGVLGNPVGVQHGKRRHALASSLL